MLITGFLSGKNLSPSKKVNTILELCSESQRLKIATFRCFETNGKIQQQAFQIL